MDCRHPPQDPDIVLDNSGSKTLSHATKNGSGPRKCED